MKFTLSWLKNHLDTSASLQEISDRLTRNGLVVDSITTPGEAFKGFKIAEILDVSPHPHGDRLNVCRVLTGTDVIQVVCGAPNARVGLKSVLGLPGMSIPATGVVLKKTTIREVESSGMLCSYRELGLGEDHQGIIELPADAPVGQEFCVYKGLDDPVFDIEITPNRGDCLSVRGIARDLAATGLGILKPLVIPPVKGLFPSPISVDITDSQGCPFFTGRVIRGVKNNPSPLWLQQKLEAVGIRPISALVDITNFMTYDRGRPLHVFDLDRLNGQTLTIGCAKDKERLHGLDDHSYALKTTHLVIADSAGPCSLAGIIGGMASGCSLETTSVFLESALFDPIRIAQAGRDLGILTDARYRFERGVDSRIISEGLEQATRLILDLCGGEPSDVIDAGTLPSLADPIPFSAERVKTLGGLDVEEGRALDILEKLGFGRPKAGWISVPSWRPDITGTADLVEEVLRIEGYEQIPAVGFPIEEFPTDLEFASKTPSLLPSSPPRIIEDPFASSLDCLWKIRRYLVSQGLSELYTWSFIKESWAHAFGGGNQDVRLENPISLEMAYMRPSLLPLLLDSLRRHHGRGYKNMAFFEVGHQYHSTGEPLVASGIRGFSTGPRHWLKKGRTVDFFDAKADFYGVLESCGFNASHLPIDASTPPWYHPARSGALTLGPKKILGYFGEIHPTILELFDLSDPVVGFEIFIESIPGINTRNTRNKAKTFIPLPVYQPVERDFAFLVNQDVPAGKILDLLRKIDKNLIHSVGIFDVYQGLGVPEGQKSIGVTVRLEPRERTLTENDLTLISQKIVTLMHENIGAVLRS